MEGKSNFSKLAAAAKAKGTSLFQEFNYTKESFDDLEVELFLKNIFKSVIIENCEKIVGVKFNLQIYTSAGLQAVDYAIKIAREKGLLIAIELHHIGDENIHQLWAEKDLRRFAPDFVILNPYIGGVDIAKPYLDVNPNIGVFFDMYNPTLEGTYIQDMPLYVKIMLDAMMLNYEGQIGFCFNAINPEMLWYLKGVELQYFNTSFWSYVSGIEKVEGNFNICQYTESKGIYNISGWDGHNDLIASLEEETSINKRLDSLDRIESDMVGVIADYLEKKISKETSEMLRCNC